MIETAYEQKSTVVQVRVTPSLKAALDAKAAEWHLNLADYLRCLFAQAVRAETPGGQPTEATLLNHISCRLAHEATAGDCRAGDFQPEEACCNR